MPTWNLSRTYAHILICNGKSCTREGAEELTKAIRGELKEQKLNDYIHTTRTKCNARCEDACTVIVYPEGTWYHHMTPEDVKPFIKAVYEKNQLPEKVSHTIGEEGFVRHNDVEVGRFRSERKQKTTASK